MGIPGILKEIGPGERVAISKLAVEHLELTGRPFRIAIDISIWQFQIQTGRGGTNPALRTLYYRLQRLLSLCIQPLFVFDGPARPLVKRGRQTGGGNISSMPNYMAKNLLDLFGFPYISAPGEAEAECALLQQEGIVDAVLSDDVDTLMFGSTLTLRNWSSEGTRGNKNPTHVNAYHSKATKEGSSGLDRAGMILVALMSGGDYAPGGIPSCGPKIACEAARAGFGNDLYKISRKDRASLNQWRERLEYELHTNESGFFRTRHRTLAIPEEFPDRTILGYYTHPVVSSAEKVVDLRKNIIWDGEVKIPELRAFAAEAFEWLGLPGARKFIRGIAPALLIQKLWGRSTSEEVDNDDLKLKADQEHRIIKSLHGKRTHSVTDGTPEVRVSFLPSELVSLDLSQEDTENYLGMNMNDDSGCDLAELAESDTNCPSSPSKRRGPSQFNPDKEQKIWIIETFAKLGVPLTVETWEEDMRDPKKYASRKAAKTKATGKSGKGTAQAARLEDYLKASKPIMTTPQTNEKSSSEKLSERSGSHGAHTQSRTALDVLSDAAGQATDRCHRVSRKLTGDKHVMRKGRGIPKAASKASIATAPRECFGVLSDPPLSTEINPWTLSQTISSTPDVELKSSHKYLTATKGRSPEGHDLNLDKDKFRRAMGNTATISLLSSPERVQTKAMGLISRKPKRLTLEAGDGNRISVSKATHLHNHREHPVAGDNTDLGNCGPLIAPKFGDRLDLSEAECCEESHLLSSQPLPPLPSSAVPRGLSSVCGEDQTIRRISKPHRNTKQSTGRAIVLRQSLEGAWKAIEEPDVIVEYSKMTFRGIEVVDLSED